MHDFLRSIAEGYYRQEGPNVASFTFVFPNSRSAKYFSEYMAGLDAIDDRRLGSLCITLTELMEKGSGLRKASRNRLLIMLHAAYVRVFERHNPQSRPEEFDRFRYWAEMLLKDFDEIDRYMVNAEELFRNVENYKEIQSFYLSEEQIRIIRDFWGNDPYRGRLWPDNDPGETAEEVPFWGHIGSHGKPTVRKYKQMWQLLGEIYTEFRASLLQLGLCYPGMACREVVNKLKQTGRLPFNPQKYVFIGFHRLSTSEHLLFEELKRLGRAHFYWDYDSALMNPATGNKAGRFISNYAKTFTDSCPTVTLPAGGRRHNVRVVRVPSNIGQVKVAAQLLHDTDTAVVLASDDLLLPMVASVPEEFEQINVTMGYPMRYSQISQLYSSLVALQLRAHAASGGGWEYFRTDVFRLLSLPVVQAVAPGEVEALRDFMKKHSLYNLPSHAVEMIPELEILPMLFRRVENPNDIDEVAAYTIDVLDLMQTCGMVRGIESAAIDAMRGQVEEISGLVKEFGIGMTHATFFRMLERAVFSRSMAVKGITFDAMQIMGPLETRCLGFSNVMMLSMNDQVFPGRNFSRSFIPESLRRAYGMPTIEHYDTDSAYLFYHILSHADNLTLIFDSRCGGNRTGELTRYAAQLARLDFPGVKLEVVLAEIGPETMAKSAKPALIELSTAIAKDKRVMDLLDRYRNPDLLKSHRLSASTLKTYMSCPMRFYLERVEEIQPAEPPRENIDAATSGSIIHEVAERVYDSLPSKHITKADIDNIIDENNPLLENELRRAINANFMNMERQVEDPVTGKKIDNPALFTTPLHGEALMYAPAFLDMLRDMFGNEPVDFDYVQGEIPDSFHWVLPTGQSINFTMRIDRIDRKDGVTRLVDYKTGKDELMYRPETLMQGGNPAVFQLLTYSEAYLFRNPSQSAANLQPMIYQVRNNPAGSGFGPIEKRENRATTYVTSYGLVREQFLEQFSAMIDEIFDESVPFVRTEDEKHCKFCPFKEFCLI